MGAECGGLIGWIDAGTREALAKGLKDWSIFLRTEYF